ncbi:MAG: caspase family protein [Myxococcaceae bacterium]
MSRAATAKSGLLLSLLLLAAPAVAETRRIAIVVGNNAGTGEMPPLRYAESDAGKMARVLVELGDVSSEDVLLLQGQRVGQVERAIAETRDRIAFLKRSPDVRTVVFFYFSGHSDGEAIELSGEKLAYARLKALLTGTGADVRLVVVDACRSGAGLREKGGRPVEGFTIRLADTLQATGDVFISSSAADEAALESSEVMGSYFTHNFISGLRGAADTSGDKLVTLAEAYRYAYDRTVSSTAMLPVGAQHPNYDFKLSGQGELVLSTLLKPSALMVLPEADRALVTDLARDQVIVEVVGAGGREVALAPGQYGLRVFKQGQSFGGRVTLVDGQRQVIAMSTLTPINSSVMVAAKGGPVVVRQADVASSNDGLGLGVSFGLGGRVLSAIIAGQNATYQPKAQLRVELEPLTSSFVSFPSGRVFGALHLLGMGEMSFDSASDATNEASGQLRVGYRVGVEISRVQFGVGLELGPGFLSQLYGPRGTAFLFTVAPRISLKVRLTRGLWLTGSGDLTLSGVSYGDTNETASFQWVGWPSAAFGLLYTF